MSKATSALLACGIGVVSAAVAVGGEPGVFGLLKGASVGLVSGGIVFALGEALDSLALARSNANRLLGDLGSHANDLPSLQEFEMLAKSRGPAVGAVSLAEELVGRLSDTSRFPRAIMGAVTSAGFCGTLLGILLASLGLHFAHGGESISNVVAWCGGSLICSVVGFASSAILGAKLASFDSDARAVKVLAESHVRELLAQNPDTADDRLAQIVAQAVSQSFVEARDIWEALRLTGLEVQKGGSALELASAQVHNASERLAEQTEVSNRIAWKLETAASNIVETAKNCAESARLLQEIFIQLMPVFRSVQAGVEGLNKSVGSLYPALESARDLQLTIKAADLVFRNLDSQVAGIAGTIQDEIKSSSDRMVSHQQKVFADGVGPPLKSIAHTMDLLLLLIDRSEQLLRNLPLAVPAKRIVDDLNAAGVAHLASAERDAKTVEEVSRRMEGAEARMEAVLQELRTAHGDIAASLKELQSETAEISRHVDEVSAHIEGPFWKKLGGRKP